MRSFALNLVHRKVWAEVLEIVDKIFWRRLWLKAELSIGETGMLVDPFPGIIGRKTVFESELHRL